MRPCLLQHNLYLLYIGLVDPAVSGSEEMLNEMKKEILSEGLNDRVKFIGYRKDVPRIMASADLLVHPTTTEGFGLTLVEAMAAGLPVVATNVEGIPEVVDGTDSIMVNPNDPHALREAVLEMLNRTSVEANSARQKGRIVAGNYRLKKRADLLVDYFENILCERN
jgi:glycosyltransferase involved in cell wall biosynthesis